jgi:hypothetical protein
MHTFCVDILVYTSIQAATCAQFVWAQQVWDTPSHPNSLSSVTSASTITTHAELGTAVKVRPFAINM